MLVSMATQFEAGSRGQSASAAARAYEYVKQRLLDGRFAGGSLLSENEIARELGLSRTPVRQAFVALQGEELLDLYPRRGAVVRPISSSEAEEILEARLLIETHCAVRVCAYGSRVAQALEPSLARQEAALPDGALEFSAADREFHHTIVAANGNSLLTRQYDALRERQQRITATAVSRDPALIEEFLIGHRAIAAAIEEGDRELVAQWISAHIESTRKLTRRRPF
jgi:DNA-binding GntR family transcriptional regulator